MIIILQFIRAGWNTRLSRVVVVVTHCIVYTTEWTITLDPQEEQPGEIWDILKAMQAHPDDRHSLLQCCIQLWDHTLTGSYIHPVVTSYDITSSCHHNDIIMTSSLDRGCDEVCQCGGVEVICVTLSVHMTHPQLSNITTSLLWSLSLRGMSHDHTFVVM